MSTPDHADPRPPALRQGIRQNRALFSHLLLQVLLVGLTIGMMRTVIPALAESDFGLPANDFFLLCTFVIAFGVVKGCMNFVAGRLAEHLGRKQVLQLGWLVALPIPLMIASAPSWNWIVAATLLLGVNQGLAWSMSQTSKLDITAPEQRGLTLGLNELAGYMGVALAGILTAYLAEIAGVRQSLLGFGLVVIVSGLLLSTLCVVETHDWIIPVQGKRASPPAASASRLPTGLSAVPGTFEILRHVSWRDRRLAALMQAGLVEKFVDALVWIFYPVYLSQQGVKLADAAWIIGIYGGTWGLSQLLTGHWSDRIGRQRLNVLGMWLCGLSVLMMPWHASLLWWSSCAALTGFGMAMLYPNLAAAVADLSAPEWRGSSIGIYRFWRDLGYAVGALVLGLGTGLSGDVITGFWITGIAMLISGVLLAWQGEETSPHLKTISSQV